MAPSLAFSIINPFYCRVLPSILFLSYNGGYYPLYYSSHTMEDITLYIIPLIQWRILPSILLLSYNGGYYPLYYSSHTMEDITLYIIPLIQWRILPSILFLSYNGGYYPLYYSSHTMEDITLYIIPLIQWRILPSILFLSYNGGDITLYTSPSYIVGYISPHLLQSLEHFFKLRLTGDLAGATTSVLYRFCSLITITLSFHDLFFFSTISLDLAK